MDGLNKELWQCQVLAGCGTIGVFTELNTCPSYNSALMFLGSDPEELKFCVHISDPLLVSIAFIIARIWK